MQQHNKFILGSGISALIFKYFNPSYKIISPDEKPGGQLTKHNNLLTTFYIHNTLETRELLNNLKIKLSSYQEFVHLKMNDL